MFGTTAVGLGSEVGPMDVIPPVPMNVPQRVFGATSQSQELDTGNTGVTVNTFAASSETVNTEVDKEVTNKPELVSSGNESYLNNKTQAVTETVYQDGMPLKDSGDRREFESGARRDMARGKGRCDLLPMSALVSMLSEEYTMFFEHIHSYQMTGSVDELKKVLSEAVKLPLFPELDKSQMSEEAYAANMLLEVAKHFEAGAEKYGDNNWRKGIPTSVYLDSAIRHLLKTIRGDKDEPHNRAVIWNLLCCLWTEQNRPECRSYRSN